MIRLLASAITQAADSAWSTIILLVVYFVPTKQFKEMKKQRLEAIKMAGQLKSSSEERARLEKKAEAERKKKIGEICHKKLMERMDNAHLVRKAQEKRWRKARRSREQMGIKEERKHVGTLIDNGLGLEMDEAATDFLFGHPCVKLVTANDVEIKEEV